MTISDHQANSDRESQQPDWASAPLPAAEQPVAAPTEHVYTDRAAQVPNDGLAEGTRPAPEPLSTPAPDRTASSFDGVPQPESVSAPAPDRAASPRDEGSALFAGDLSGLRSRWNDVQASFVDDPRDCVHQADGLVSDVVDQLTANFAQARTRLEAQWDRGEEASTEDLRLALQSYRQFFDRLLTV